MSALPASLLPHAGRRNAVPWLIAATAFVMALATAAGLALGRGAEAVAEATGGRLTIAIVATDPGRRAAAAAEVATLLARLPGVRGVHRLSDAEIARLTGLDGPPAETLPAMIDATVPPPDRETLRTALAPLRDVRMTGQSESLDPLLRLIAALRHLALLIVLLAIAAIALAAVLVARAALSGHSATVAILRDLGASDRQLARLIARRAGIDALIGGAAGLGLAFGAILVIASHWAALDGGRAGIVALWPEAGLLAMLPPGIGLVAMIAAGATVMIQLRRAEG